MLLPLITSTAVAAAKGTWLASSIFVKYLIIGLVAKNFYEDKLTVEALEEDILDSSEIVVTGLVASGLIFAFTGLSPEPVLKLFSELVALVYFGYLFWKY